MESLVHTLKTELRHHRHSATRAEATWDIFAYIEGFYNRTRVTPPSALSARSRWS
ncbi:IS3 family transposase [Bradyrhizobium sp. 521_C7_N1_3]|uniref:IS3 family transposase n=1 Tax=Bradyrhizobium sp. 521_C7_N1_3 TaxID=3240368 RepID=UPI003F8B0C3E